MTGLSERAQLGDEAASFVRDQITSGALAPGSPVRPDAVASVLGISSTPAREALQALRTEGLLELAPRRGFTVATITGEDIRDIFYVHSLVAGEIAARVAANATREQLEKLESMYAGLSQGVRDGNMQDHETHDFAFHSEINRIGGSPKLAWMLKLVSRYVPRGFYVSIEGWPETAMDDYERLLKALRERDSELARQTLSAYVVRSGETLAEYIDSRPARP